MKLILISLILTVCISQSVVLYSTTFDTHADWTAGFYQGQNQSSSFYFRWSNQTWSTSSILNSPVSSNSFLFLQSPSIDLSVSDPTKLQVLEATLRFDIPTGSAGVNFQYSLNGGAFQTIVTSAPSSSWYSASTINDFASISNFLGNPYGWSSSVNGLRSVNVTLPQLSGKSSIVFRLNFASSAASTTNFGVSFSSFSIYEISDVNIPLCVIRNTPLIDSTGLLSWSQNSSEPVGTTTAYLLSVGTDSPPTNWIYRLQLANTQLTYQLEYPFSLSNNSVLYWQVTPINANGTKAFGCSVFSVTFISDPIVDVSTQYFQNFDSGFGSLPSGWRQDSGSGNTLKIVNNITRVTSTGIVVQVYNASSGFLLAPASFFPDNSFLRSSISNLYTPLFRISSLTTPWLAFSSANALSWTSVSGYLFPFQRAFAVGTLYVDVTSDRTTTPSTNWTNILTLSEPRTSFISEGIDLSRWLQFGVVRFRFHFDTSNSWADIGIDNFYVTSKPTAPNYCALNPFFNATNVFFSKSSSETPSNYLVSMGTNSATLTSIYPRLQLNSTTFTISLPQPPMNDSVPTYWRVTPRASLGATPNTTCPLWSFTETAMPPITVFPYSTNFSEGIPSGWNNDEFFDGGNDFKASVVFGPDTRGYVSPAFRTGNSVAGDNAYLYADCALRITAESSITPPLTEFVFLYTPIFKIDYLTSPTLSVAVSIRNPASGAYSPVGQISIDFTFENTVNENTSWRTLVAYDQHEDTSAFMNIQIDLRDVKSLAPAGTVRFRFRHQCSPTGVQNALIDDFSIFDRTPSLWACPTVDVGKYFLFWSIVPNLRFGSFRLYASPTASPTPLSGLVNGSLFQFNSIDFPLPPISQNYYVQLVQENAQGMSTGCPVLTVQNSDVVVVTSLPYKENFESGASLNSLGWVNYRAYSGIRNYKNWTLTNTLPSSGMLGDHTTGFGRFLTINPQTTLHVFGENWLSIISPVFQLSQNVSSAVLTFWFGNRPLPSVVLPNNLIFPTGKLTISVFHGNTWDSSSWTDVLAISQDYYRWSPVIVDLSLYLPFTYVRFHLDQITQTARGTPCIDDIEMDVAKLPTCPSIVSSTTQYSSRVEISFSQSPYALRYFISVGSKNVSDIYNKVLIDSLSLNGPVNLFNSTISFAFALPEGSYFFAIYADGTPSNSQQPQSLLNDDCVIRQLTVEYISKITFTESFDNSDESTFKNFATDYNVQNPTWLFTSNLYGGAVVDHSTNSLGKFASRSDSEYFPTVLTSPTFQLSLYQNPRVTFWYLNRGASTTTTTNILHIDARFFSFSSTTNYKQTYRADIIPPLSVVAQEWTPITIDLSSLVPNNVTLEFRVTGGNPTVSTTPPSEVCVDDFLIEDVGKAPVCLPISYQVIGSDVYVSIDQFSSQWNYFVSFGNDSVGTNIFNNTPISSISRSSFSSFVRLPLSASLSSTYKLSVRPQNSFGNVVGGLCPSVSIALNAITNFPFVTNFDDDSYLNNWATFLGQTKTSFSSTNSNVWRKTTTTTTTHGPRKDHSIFGAGSFVSISDSSVSFPKFGFNSGVSRLISKPIVVTSLTSPTLSFWFMNQQQLSLSGIPRLYVEVQRETTSTWETVLIVDSSYTQWTQFFVSLDSFKTSNFISIRFAVALTGIGLSDPSLDDISIFDAGVSTLQCPSTVSLIGGNYLIWNSVVGAVDYQVLISNSSNSIVNVSTTSQKSYLQLTSTPIPLQSNVTVRFGLINQASSVQLCSPQIVSVSKVNTYPTTWSFDSGFSGWANFAPFDDSQNTWKLTSSFGAVSSDHTTQKGLFLVSQSNSSYLLSPYLQNLNSLSSPKLSFWFYLIIPAGAGRVSIVVDTSLDGVNFSNLYTQNTLESGSWTFSSISLTQNAAFVRIGMSGTSASLATLSLDDVIVFDGSVSLTCSSIPIPTVTIENSVLRISWIPIASFSDQEYVIDISNSMGVSQQRMTVSAYPSSFSVSLAAGNYSVKAIPIELISTINSCSSRSVTIKSTFAWSISTSFTTNFGNWSDLSVNSQWQRKQTTQLGAISDRVSSSTSYFLSAFAFQSEKSASLVSNNFDLSFVSSATLSFYFMNQFSSISRLVSPLTVLISNSSNSNWNVLGIYSNSTTSWTNIVLDISSYKSKSTRIQFVVDLSVGTDTSTVCLDDVVVSALPHTTTGTTGIAPTPVPTPKPTPKPTPQPTPQTTESAAQSTQTSSARNQATNDNEISNTTIIIAVAMGMVILICCVLVGVLACCLITRRDRTTTTVIEMKSIPQKRKMPDSDESSEETPNEQDV